MRTSHTFRSAQGHEVVYLQAGDSLARWSAYSKGSRKGPCAKCFGLGVREHRGGIRVCECAEWGVEYERTRFAREARRRLKELSAVELPGDSRRRGGVWGLPIVEARINALWAIRRLSRPGQSPKAEGFAVADQIGVLKRNLRDRRPSIPHLQKPARLAGLFSG